MTEGHVFGAGSCWCGYSMAAYQAGGPNHHEATDAYLELQERLSFLDALPIPVIAALAMVREWELDNPADPRQLLSDPARGAFRAGAAIASRHGRSES